MQGIGEGLEGDHRLVFNGDEDEVGTDVDAGDVGVNHTHGRKDQVGEIATKTAAARSPKDARQNRLLNGLAARARGLHQARKRGLRSHSRKRAKGHQEAIGYTASGLSVGAKIRFMPGKETRTSFGLNLSQ